MFLHDLDEDVLSIIISYLSPNRADVINLALTHRAFYPVAKYPEHISISCPSTQFISLTNIFIENPTYGYKVQSLILRVDGPKDTISRAKIHAFLERMPNVRVLKMDADVKPHHMKVLLSGDLTLRNSLQDLRVKDSTLSLQDLLTLLTLPKLHHISIPILPKLNPNSSIPQTLPLIPNLRSLHLGLSDSSFPPYMMRQIFSRTTSLQSLEWKIPLDGPRAHPPATCPWCPHRLYSISSALTLDTLSCISRTLVNLKLFTNGSLKISLDGSRLDLSSFVKLRRLEAGAEFWFQGLDGNVDVDRGGFYRFLPEGLESLTLVFMWEICLFYDHDTSKVKFDVLGRKAFVEGTMDRGLYRWIEEVGERKESCFPGLKRVVIREQTSRRGEGSESERWVVPERTRELFEGVGTELEVWVRTAKVRNVPWSEGGTARVVAVEKEKSRGNVLLRWIGV